jgi:hypothetical protein
MQHNGWDHGLTVTADGTGLIGHAGAVLLRKAADQAGLTAGLSSAFRQIRHLLAMSSPRKTVLFTCGWMITAADEAAIMRLPADAWKPGIAQDGDIEEDKDVAEITHLMSRAGNWPDGLRWIARRVKPSRRQMRNLTDYEKKTGWRYSITCTNIPDTGIARGARQPPPAVHRRRPPRARGRRNQRRRDRQGHGAAEPAIENLAGQLRLDPRREHRGRPHRLGQAPRTP